MIYPAYETVVHVGMNIHFNWDNFFAKKVENNIALQECSHCETSKQNVDTRSGTSSSCTLNQQQGARKLRCRVVAGSC